MGACLKVWLTLAFATSGCFALQLTCPPQEDITPCVCDDNADYIVVTCRHVPDVQTLFRGIRGLSNNLVDELWIEDSDLGDVPGETFNGTHIATITFLNTKIRTLGDSDCLPFAGLERILKGLTITEGFTEKGNPLLTPIKLQHLERLEFLSFEGNVLKKVDNDWFSYGYQSLKSLYINDCGVEELGDKVFSNLEQLSILDLSENKLGAISRSMLPSKALHLSVIWLRKNKIQSLPDDIFTDLPSLDRLYLPGNELKTLPEDTWKRILRQLSLLFLNGNPLVCDSNLKWFLGAKTPEFFEARCKEPESLAGKHLSHLTEDDLRISA